MSEYAAYGSAARLVGHYGGAEGALTRRVREQPFGIVLFLATFAMVPLAATGLVRSWSVVATLDRLHAEKIAIGLSVLCMVVWTIRVSIEYFTAA